MQKRKCRGDRESDQLSLIESNIDVLCRLLAKTLLLKLVIVLVK